VSDGITPLPLNATAGTPFSTALGASARSASPRLLTGNAAHGCDLQHRRRPFRTSLQTGSFPIDITVTDTRAVAPSRNRARSSSRVRSSRSARRRSPSERQARHPGTTLTQSGGIGTATFAVTGGALPAGLALSSGGVVSGTPTVTGPFNFTVTATDANGCTGSRTCDDRMSDHHCRPDVRE
jgi:hypothetical protein